MSSWEVDVLILHYLSSINGAENAVTNIYEIIKQNHKELDDRNTVKEALEDVQHLPQNAVVNLLENIKKCKTNQYWNFKELTGFGRHSMLNSMENEIQRSKSFVSSLLMRDFAKGNKFDSKFQLRDSPFSPLGAFQTPSYRLSSSVFGHIHPVYCCCIDYTGLRLYTGSDDHLVKIWSVLTGRLLKSMRGHTAEITDVGISPNNEIICSSSIDCTARLWTLNGEPLTVLRGHAKDVLRVQFVEFWDNPTVITCCLDGSCGLWTLDGTVRKVIKYSSECIWATVNESCSEIVLCYSDGTVSFLKLVDGEMLATSSLHTKDVIRALFSRVNTDHLLSLSSDGNAIISKRAGSKIKILTKIFFTGKTGRSVPLLNGVWSHDGTKVILSGSKYVSICSCSNGDVLHRFEHDDLVSVLFLHPLWNIVFSAGFDGSVILTDYNFNREVQKLQCINRCTDLSVSKDGSTFALTTDVGRINIYRISPEPIEQDFEYSPEEQFFVSDYGEFQTDSFGNSVDLQTNLALHLSPSGPLGNLLGQVYPLQPPQIRISESLSIISSAEYLERQHYLNILNSNYSFDLKVDETFDYLDELETVAVEIPLVRKLSSQKLIEQVADVEPDIIEALEGELDEPYALISHDRHESENSGNLSSNSDNSDVYDSDDEDLPYFDFSDRKSRKRRKQIRKSDRVQKFSRSRRSVSYNEVDNGFEQDIMEETPVINYNWLDTTIPLPYSYVPQIDDELVLFLHPFSVAEPKQAVSILKKYSGKVFLCLKIIAIDYMFDKSTKCPCCKLYFRRIEDPVSNNIQSLRTRKPLIRSDNYWNQSTEMIARSVASDAPEETLSILLRPTNEPDYLVLREKVDNALGSSKFNFGTTFVSQYADSDILYHGTILSANFNSYENIWDSVTVSWLEDEAEEVISPWDVIFDGEILSSLCLSDLEIEQFSSFMNQQLELYPEFEDLSLLGSAYPVSFKMIIQRLINKYYRSKSAVLRDITQLRINIEKFHETGSDIVHRSIMFEYNSWNIFSPETDYPLSSHPLKRKNEEEFFKRNDRYEATGNASKIDFDGMEFSVKTIDVHSFCVRLSRKKVIRNHSLFDSIFKYAVSSVNADTETVRIRKVLM